ncbi:MAG: DUF3443 family protein [Bacillota bacterium]
MNSFRLVFLLLSVGFLWTACSGTSSSGTATVTPGPAVYFPTELSGGNVIPLSVGACGVYGYHNEPCISVTICSPGSTVNCQTINNILVDTGSYGLKIFKSLITVPLSTIQVGGADLANCTGYLDGSGHWGPMKMADVVLGSKRASNVPIVALDASYYNSQATAKCTPTPDASPADAGFNGIIGVGGFVHDCDVGSTTSPNKCASSVIPKSYFSCSSTTKLCVSTAVAESSQLTNPISLMPAGYNNGVVIKLPSVPTVGAGAAYGYMILGIGTASDPNNEATGVTVYPTSNSGYFTTTFNGTGLVKSFVDSGSNFLFFPKTNSLPFCSGSTTWYCPTSTQALTASLTGAGGAPTGSVNFDIGNTNTLISYNNMVYDNIGGDIGDPSMFDWGLPFFLGRSVFVGINGSTATVNTNQTASGPFWAF